MVEFLLNPKTIIYAVGGAAFGYFLSASFFPNYLLITTIVGGGVGVIASLTH